MSWGLLRFLPKAVGVQTGTLRVAFESTQFAASLTGESPAMQQVRLLIGKLAEASAIRAVQADSIARLVAGYKGGGIIVCGDFNDSPISYTHRVVGEGLNDAFVESGNGFGKSRNIVPSA